MRELDKTDTAFIIRPCFIDDFQGSRDKFTVYLRQIEGDFFYEFTVANVLTVKNQILLHYLQPLVQRL